jgi:hypothetical protein
MLFRGGDGDAVLQFYEFFIKQSFATRPENGKYRTTAAVEVFGNLAPTGHFRTPTNWKTTWNSNRKPGF